MNIYYKDRDPIRSNYTSTTLTYLKTEKVRAWSFYSAGSLGIFLAHATQDLLQTYMISNKSQRILPDSQDRRERVDWIRNHSTIVYRLFDKSEFRDY